MSNFEILGEVSIISMNSLPSLVRDINIASAFMEAEKMLVDGRRTQQLNASGKPHVLLKVTSVKNEREMFMEVIKGNSKGTGNGVVARTYYEDEKGRFLMDIGGESKRVTRSDTLYFSGSPKSGDNAGTHQVYSKRVQSTNARQQNAQVAGAQTDIA
jgi:hypothetical protein